MFNLHPAYWINYKARMRRDQVYPVDVVIVINDLDKSWPDGLFIFFNFLKRDSFFVSDFTE